jgi:tetratricopeptide (TPR) repeat protein
VLKSLQINEHPSALQTMAEILFRQSLFADAASFIERKLDESPIDPFALSIYADILWQLDRKSEALTKIIEALKHQPRNANFWFRAGRFLQDSNELEQAFEYFSRALNIDNVYLDARLSLADVCLDMRNPEGAKAQIDFLENKVKGEKIAILNSIRANYYIHMGDLNKAEEIAESILRQRRNVENVGLMSKIYIYKYRDLRQKNLDVLADTFKEKALRLLDEGLRLEADNKILIKMKEQLLS